MSDANRAGRTEAGAATAPAAHSRAAGAPRRSWLGWRREIPRWQAFLIGVLCLAGVFAAWWCLTAGETAESRWFSPAILPSPEETFRDFHSIWFDRELTRNTLASLRRVTLGFGLAAVVGVPLGVLCGCFTRINAFFSPLVLFGRNIPVAALIPLTFTFFGIGETQKVMFLFIACVAFVVFDTARAIGDVSDRYVDTAYTLGASRRQIILKVLVPLAMPSIFNSLRLLFGLAFGYIMLVELITVGGSAGGLGSLINIAQRLNKPTLILLVLMIIPIVALAIDRVLFWMQRELFPHQYGGNGILLAAVRIAVRRWEDLKSLVIRPTELPKAMSRAETGG